MLSDFSEKKKSTWNNKSEADKKSFHKWQPQSWELIEFNYIDILLELNFVFVSHHL